MAATATPIAYLSQLTFQDGTQLDLSPTSVVVIVGPNNVGKSTALGELASFIANLGFVHNQRKELVFRAGQLEVAEDAELQEWFRQFEHAVATDPINAPAQRKYRNWASETNIDPSQIPYHMRQYRQTLAPFLLSTGSSPPFEGQIPDFYGTQTEGDNQQFQQLYNDPELEAEISALSQRVFGTPVSLSRGTRRSVLHFGSVPDLGLTPTEELKGQLRAVPRVDQQGEGVKSLLGLAMHLRLGQEPFFILDEPDAHLHPPQARQAGQFVAERGKRSQVFIATHSMDFLLGILDAQVDTTIIRLDRATGVQRVAILDKGVLRKSWDDTTVRFSGALAGLMHRGVVLCEGDGDCRYYEVVLDYARAGQQAHDLRFVHAGGKAGIKKLAKVLKSIAVPLSIVVDFDFLREWSAVRDLFVTLGGDPLTVQPAWNSTNQYLLSLRESRTVSDIRKAVLQELQKHDDSDTFGPSIRTGIQVHLRDTGGWAEAKRRGLGALRSTALTEAKQLLELLAERGIHVLPFGELEGLHPEAPTSLHGPAFATHVIETKAFTQLNKPALDFIRSIADVA